MPVGTNLEDDKSKIEKDGNPEGTTGETEDIGKSELCLFCFVLEIIVCLK